MKLSIITTISTLSAAMAIPLASTVHAADTGGMEAEAAVLKDGAFARQRSAGSDLNPLVFSAPPRETPVRGKEIYGPIADYLSKVLGRKVVYRHPGTWGVYRTEMLRGAYDILFDGPHFNSYRAQKLNHNILAKIPKRHDFVVIVRKDSQFQSLDELAGHTFCSHAPPNLGTLVLLSQFSNPARQPVILNTKGWGKIYKGVIAGRCVAGILPILNLKKVDAAGKAKIVFKARTLPNQAFSAGPRLSAAEQAKVAAALVSPEASGPTENLRATYKVGPSFAPTSNEEYAGIAEFLKNEWGYY